MCIVSMLAAMPTGGGPGRKQKPSPRGTHGKIKTLLGDDKAPQNRLYKYIYNQGEKPGRIARHNQTVVGKHAAHYRNRGGVNVLSFGMHRPAIGCAR